MRGIYEIEHCLEQKYKRENLINNKKNKISLIIYNKL